MRLAALALALFALSGGAAAAACDPGERVLRFSHVVAATGHPKGNAASAFAARINEELHGRACMEVYPANALFTDDEVLERLLSGDVEFAAPSLSKFEAYTTRFRVFDLPFLFEDIHGVERFQASPMGRSLMRSIEGAGLRGLAYWHNGLKQVSATRPLLRPEDAAGLTFRIQASEVIEAQIEAMGATPVRLPFRSVTDALASGQVDGQENTWSNIYTQRFHDHQDGVTESNHGLLDYLVVTSVAFWDGLPPGLRSDLAAILAEVTHEYNRFSFEINALAKIKLIEEGAVVRRLSAEERAVWVAAFQPVWRRFEEEIGRDVLQAALGGGEG